MIAESYYALILSFVGLAAVVIGLIHFRCRLKQAPNARQMARRGSVLAERMADINRLQHSRENIGPPPARRLFRLASNDDSSPPREDSPLLGSQQRMVTEETKRTVENMRYLDVGGNNSEGVALGRQESEHGSDAASKITTPSATHTTLSAADESLLRTFMEVMWEGLPVKILRASGRAKKATMWLKDTDTLVWCWRRALGTKKWNRMSLRGVARIEDGTSFNAPLSPGGGKANVAATPERDALCISLIFHATSLNVEASSELERDALVQGFSMLIEDLKVADELKERDVEVRTGRF